MKKTFIYKRVIAYVLDVLIIAMVTSVIMLPFSKSKEYQEQVKELTQITESYKNDVITESEYERLSTEFKYSMSKINAAQTLVLSSVSLIYFIGLNLLNKGQTLGKKIMKIRIVGKNKEKASINSYVIRTLVGNTVFVNLILGILILTISKESYLIYESKLLAVFEVIYLSCLIFALWRNDGRGLHDLLAGTIVINDSASQEVKEIEVVKEKKKK